MTDLITETGLLTVAEAAALVRKSPRTWRMWHSAGLVPKPVRIGRSIFWRAEELRAWVAHGCPERAKWEHLKPIST